MNIHHLKKIRKKFRYCFKDGKMHLFNDRKQKHWVFNSVYEFMESYVYDIGIGTALSWQERYLKRRYAIKYRAHLRLLLLPLILLAACDAKVEGETEHDRWCRMMDSSTHYLNKVNEIHPYIMVELKTQHELTKRGVYDYDTKERDSLMSASDRLYRMASAYRDSAFNINHH